MRYLATIKIFIVCFCFLQCQSFERKPGTTASLGKGSLIQRILNNYSGYRKLKINFQLTGFLGGEEYYYIGELYSEAHQKITMVLQEPILKSPLISFSWDNKRMLFKDELKNKTSKIPFAKGSKMKLIQQEIPAQILFPLLQGLCGLIIKKKNVLFNKADQSLRLEYLDSRFIMNFGERGELNKIMVKGKNDDKITLIEINDHFWYDKKTNKQVRRPSQKNFQPNVGSFYKKIYVYTNYSEDYFKIEATRFGIELN